MERAEVSYTPKYQRFLIKERRFQQQYSHLYSKRIETSRPWVVKAACAKWDADPASICGKVIDMRVKDSTIVVGTLYKDMPLKPNVLNEFSAGVQGPPPARANYCSAEDELILEDESGRVVLDGVDAVKHTVVTGVVVAVRGTVSEDGKLVVDDICAAGVPAAKPLPPPTSGAAPHILLVSGLNLGSDTFNPLPLLLLSEFVQGCLGGELDAATVANIVRVVVVGGLVDQPDKDFADKTLSTAEQAVLAAPLESGDVILSQIAAAVPVDVMPGAKDPSNYTLPQQPLHRALFPLASRFSSFRPVTNPYDADIGGARLLGASGQPVKDLLQYTSPELSGAAPAVGAEASAGASASPSGDVPPGGTPVVDLLQNTLEWRHMAPTAPDTLACYPFYETDPFVIDAAPHVYFSGDAAKFETKLVDAEHGTGTRVVAVPSFSATGTAVLVNLATLECNPMTFAANPADLA